MSALRWLQTNDWEKQNNRDAPVKIPAGTDTFDYQFVYIREALKPYYEEIMEAEEPMAQLAYAMYSINRNYVEGIVKAIPNVKISVIGGIQINV